MVIQINTPTMDFVQGTLGGTELEFIENSARFRIPKRPAVRQITRVSASEIVQAGLSVISRSDVPEITHYRHFRNVIAREIDVRVLMDAEVIVPLQSLFQEQLNLQNTDIILERVQEETLDNANGVPDAVLTLTTGGNQDVYLTIAFKAPGTLHLDDMGGVNVNDNETVEITRNILASINQVERYARHSRCPDAVITDGIIALLIDFEPLFRDGSPPKVAYVTDKQNEGEGTIRSGFGGKMAVGLKGFGLFKSRRFQ
ncbi:hypothetical protein TRVA0_021S00386 [Trichomonascus vanleenenianus]|uniref:uncharacterized protein n=1 Tax=Trichomonascus vanleenenianus TaxID=2268995 RepID=UPI003ECAB219